MGKKREIHPVLFVRKRCYMMLIGLVIIILAIAIGSVMYVREKRLQSYLLQRSLGERQASAYDANALIVQAQGGMVGAGQARMNLTLEVLAGQNDSYIAKTTWLVDITALDYMKTGSQVSVRIDREDRNLVYPGATWATYVVQ